MTVKVLSSDMASSGYGHLDAGIVGGARRRIGGDLRLLILILFIIVIFSHTPNRYFMK